MTNKKISGQISSQQDHWRPAKTKLNQTRAQTQTSTQVASQAQKHTAMVTVREAVRPPPVPLKHIPVMPPDILTLYPDHGDGVHSNVKLRAQDHAATTLQHKEGVVAQEVG